MPRREEESDESEIDSEFSDVDYSITNIPSQLNCISKEKVNELYNKQSGLCYISNIPMNIEKTCSIYSIDIAPRRITEPITDENCILVINGVKTLQESIGLTWTQFKAFIDMISRD